jgi:hypothetical protein
VKKTLAILAALMAVAASAQMIVYPDGTLHAAGPKVLGATVAPNIDQLIAAGYRLETPEEQAARESAAAAAQAEAAAQAAKYDFPQPDVTIPVLDADGNRTGTARLLVDASGNVVAVTDTSSPQRTWDVQMAEYKAKMAARGVNLSAAKTKAASANSVPALRAAVAALIAAVEGGAE